MENVRISDTGGSGSWTWNWTEFCGYRGGIKPMDPETHDLGICFQQLWLQIPVLAFIAIISAYHCGRHNSSREYSSYYSVNIRVFLTACLALLPIIRAYIILTNTTLISLNSTVHKASVSVSGNVSSASKGNDSIPLTDADGVSVNLDRGIRETTREVAVMLFRPKDRVQNDDELAWALGVESKATSAKPIDYLVAGTEGLAWFIHICFVLSLRRGSHTNPRGPVLMRALIFLLIVITVSLLRSHVKHKQDDDVLANLSLGFSISVVTLLFLYALTLIPGRGAVRAEVGNSARYTEIGEHTALLSAPGSSSYVRFPEEQDPSYLGTAMEGATLASKLSFHWVNPLMEKGARRLLNHCDDLFDLPESISTGAISCEIHRRLGKTRKISPNEEDAAVRGAAERAARQDRKVQGDRIDLLRLLHSCFGWQFYTVGLLKFFADCSSFAGPILLNRLIGFIEDRNEPISRGYLYATLMFLSALLSALCNAHFTFWMSVVGLKIRSAIVTLVYRKTLHSSSVELNRQFNFGEIINFMTTDNDRVVNSCPSFHTFWSIPFQLAVALYLLYRQIGLSFLAGVAFAVILIPINRKIASKIGDLSVKLMEYKDKRVGLMGEILRGITTIKMNVWEEHFLRSVLKLRESEMKYLRGRKYLDALCVYFWATTPVLISILTFMTYVLAGHRLDARTVFTSMALLNMLIGPLNAFPWVLNGLAEAWVSVKRIQRLLDLPDMDEQSYYSDPPRGTEVMLRSATLTVPGARRDSGPATAPSALDTRKSVSFEDDQAFVLRDLDIAVQKGQLVGIMGKVGSGKSLLLDGILGEITKSSGIIAVNNLDKGFAYVKQKPWLQRGTIRENILFGKTYEFNKYKSVLKACALTEDLNSLPKQDLTAVGEAGSTLSGGQKTRISLARAVYADKDVYLLDDVLATLDVKVANHVFQHVIVGLLRNKTRIFCTHQIQYLIYANHVAELSMGRIAKQGKPSDVLPDLEDYLLSSESTETGGGLDVVSIKELPREPKDERATHPGGDSLTDEEEECAEKGPIRLGVLGTYVRAVGRYLAACILLSMILMQSSKNVADLWLSYWVSHANASAVNSTAAQQRRIGRLEYFLGIEGQDDGYYLTVYGSLALLNSVFTLIRAFMFAYGGIRGAVTLHKQLVRIVVRAKSTFFDVQPLGRIINRFSSDTYTADDSLPFIANILLAQLFGLLATIIVTAYGLPWIFLVLAPLVPVYHWLQNRYRLASRELKRLSSAALSPLYGHFNETLGGLSTIRAFRAVSRFKRENELFLEASQKTQFASMAVGQWLALRLQLVGVTLLAGVSVMAVSQHQFDLAGPGLIGLVVTYTLSISGLLSGLVNAFTETEREMIAVERIKQYFEGVPVESTVGENPPYAWPSQGVVEFRDVVLRYREHLEPSLKHVSFATRPAEKIGVVGRTGAGKSSILVSLFRLVDATAGDILVDNVNIRSLRLNALRSRVAVIPQDPFLFSATVRENIDPLNQYADHHIYKALEKCKIHSLVCRLGGLGALLEEGGSNLSAGQRQLFCLVRAVLHNAKIVCVDEATANVDQETDKFIQATLKSSFRSATVFTIAHRIRSVMHCDRVLVMGDGEVLEFDEPNLLIENTDSYFYGLASEEFAAKE